MWVMWEASTRTGVLKGARVTTQARLPVIDQRRKWAKHIDDYLASLQVSGEQVHFPS